MQLFKAFLIILFTLVAFCTVSSAQETQEESIASIIESRLSTIPLPDPSSYYGQNDAFAQAISKNYCEAAKQKDLYLGKEGWIFTRNTLVDFGREELKRNDLDYDEIVYWLEHYHQALTTVGVEEPIMMVVPSKALVGETYLTPELKALRSELNTEADHYKMYQAYIDAGFEHVPDLLTMSRQAAKASEGTPPFPHYPTDHHFTSYSAWLWSGAAAQSIMSSEIYANLEKSPVKIQMKEERHEELGWEHMKVVAEICRTDYPAIYLPHYYLESDSDASLLDDKKDEIVVVGSSNIGYQFNRAGSYGPVGTPGTGTADFLAHITHLNVLKYGIYSQANAAIEDYLRTDFVKKPPPNFLVQYLESHAFPYPAYNFRSLPALTYGKCSEPVFGTSAPRKGRINVDFSELNLEDDTGEYYLWLELSQPAEKHSTWVLTEKYESGLTNMFAFETDDRFMNYPTTFGLQLLPNQTNLNEIQIRPESGWRGENIEVSVCSIEQVTKNYSKLGR